MSREVEGIGIGLRYDLATELLERRPRTVSWVEIHPENYLDRGGRYQEMLELAQIGQMLATPGVPAGDSLRRYRYARFSAVLVNVLVMWLALPTFLLREPANMLFRAVMCAALTIPVLLGSALFMAMELPGIAPAVGVFLPVVILIPVVLAQWTFVKT